MFQSRKSGKDGRETGQHADSGHGVMKGVPEGEFNLDRLELVA